MTLLFLLLKTLLAGLLAYLGGAFVRNVRGLCAENAPAALQRDRLLGLALYAVSLFTGGVAAARLAAAGSALAAMILAGGGLLWLGALWLGLRRAGSLAAVRIVAIAAVLAVVALVVSANGALTGADLFLLVGALVWLGTTLLRPRRKAP